MTTTPAERPRVVEGRLLLRVLVVALAGSTGGAMAVSIAVVAFWQQQNPIGEWHNLALFFLLCMVIAMVMAVPTGLVIAIASTIGGTIGKQYGRKHELWLTAAGGATVTLLASGYAATASLFLSPLVAGFLVVGSLATLAFALNTRWYRRKADRSIQALAV